METLGGILALASVVLFLLALVGLLVPRWVRQSSRKAVLLKLLLPSFVLFVTTGLLMPVPEEDQSTSVETEPQKNKQPPQKARQADEDAKQAALEVKEAKEAKQVEEEIKRPTQETKKAEKGLAQKKAEDVVASEFVNPIKFDGSEKEKADVVSFIEVNVKETYGAVGMDDPSTLRMMEQEELESFKELTKVENKELLNGVIKQYCGVINMCTYSTILMMYNEQNEASKKKLEW